MHGDHRVNRLKLHELQVLLAAAQAGSMAKAAAQLAMSEPAVSRSISDMERTLGVSLFDRSSKGVKPTRMAAHSSSEASPSSMSCGKGSGKSRLSRTRP
jgi:DNA-binding transcriptional LysR family regulator